MVTSPYTYMMYIVSPLAGVGGGIFWRPPAYSLLMCRMPSRLWEEWHLVCDVTWVSACWWWWFDCSAALHFIEFQFSLLPHPSSLLSLHFSGVSRWTWVSRVFFQLRMMEVVAATGAIGRAKLQSHRLHQQTGCRHLLLHRNRGLFDFLVPVYSRCPGNWLLCVCVRAHARTCTISKHPGDVGTCCTFPWVQFSLLVTTFPLPHQMNVDFHVFLHCALASGTVYCNRSCLCVCGGRAVSVTTITRNCVHRSSPNWVCRCR